LLSEKFDVGKMKDKYFGVQNHRQHYRTCKRQFQKEEPSFEDAKGEVAAVESIDDEDVNIQKDLCLQIPVFVEKEAKGEDFDLKDKKIWVMGDNDGQVRKVAQYFAELSAGVEEFVFEYKGTQQSSKRMCRVYKQKP